MRRPALAAPALVLLALGLLVGAVPAAADVVLLANGDVLVGELDAGPFPVVTPEGTVQVAAGDVREIVLGTLHGDVVRLRTGAAVTGWVDRGAYAVRLRSGPTVVVPRAAVAVVRVPGR